MPKRSSSSTKLDKRLTRVATVLTIAVSIIILVGVFSSTQLTIVLNNENAEIDSLVLAYADGVYYRGSAFPDMIADVYPDFDTATISGTVVFYIAILAGSVDAITLEIYPDGVTTPLVSKAAAVSTFGLSNVIDFDYQVSYDTTQIPNGVYWFKLMADLSADTTPPGGGDPGKFDVPLSIFGMELSAEGSVGIDTPIEAPMIPIMVIIVSGLFVVIIVIAIVVRKIR